MIIAITVLAYPWVYYSDFEVLPIALLTAGSRRMHDGMSAYCSRYSLGMIVNLCYFDTILQYLQISSCKQFSSSTFYMNKHVCQVLRDILIQSSNVEYLAFTVRLIFQFFIVIFQTPQCLALLDVLHQSLKLPVQLNVPVKVKW